MWNIQAIWLLAAVVTSAQGSTETPGAWEQKYEAATTAGKAGDPARAEALLREVVAEAETFGPDDLRLAEPLERLAVFSIQKPRERYAEGETLVRRALAIREKAQGTEHPDVANSLVDLATCLTFAKGKSSETAGPILQRALAIYEKANGKDDPEVARVLHNIALWHLFRREYGDAVSALTRALAIREETSGRESAKVADLLDDLGDLHAAQSALLLNWLAFRHRGKAEEFYTRALSIREKVLKPDDPDIAESLFNLGQFALFRGKPAEAEQYLERWMAWKERAKTPASEEQGKVVRLLAMASMRREDIAEAERRMARAQAIVDEVKGPESDEAVLMLSERADIALDAEHFDDAERFLKRGLAVETARLGPDNPDVTEARALLAGHHEDRRGQKPWQRLRDIGERARWRNHHEALGVILENYADLLRRTRRDLPRL